MPMSDSTRSVWRNGDFLKLWGGETVSQFGVQITTLALPLVAILVLDATPAQVGALNAATYLPFMVLTLFAGVWIDRRRRRPILILANAGRAVLIGVIPLLYLLSALTMPALYGVTFLVGVLTVLFELSYQSYVPSLVERDSLIEANSKLQLSASAAQIGGPGLGGLLVQVLGAPIALLANALTFMVSVFSLTTIKRQEPATEPPEGSEAQRVWVDIKEGLAFTWSDARLRPCALEAATYNLFWMAFETAFLIYVARTLDLSAGLIGGIISCGAVGAFAGAGLAERTARRLGIGPTILYAMILGCAAPVLVPLASGSQPIVVAVLVLSFFLGGAGTTVANIHVVSMRQTITPHRLLGRMNASYRFLAWGVVPFGAGLGGGLATVIGLRPTLFVSAVGLIGAALWVLFSPVPRYRTLADMEVAEPAALEPSP
jgi:MFS family permease